MSPLPALPPRVCAAASAIAASSIRTIAETVAGIGMRRTLPLCPGRTSVAESSSAQKNRPRIEQFEAAAHDVLLRPGARGRDHHCHIAPFPPRIVEAPRDEGLLHAASAQ